MIFNRIRIYRGSSALLYSKLIITLCILQSIIAANAPGFFSQVIGASDKIYIFFGILYLALLVSKTKRITVPFSLLLCSLVFLLGVLSLAVAYPNRFFSGVTQYFLLMQAFFAILVFSNLKWSDRDIESLINFFLFWGVISFILSVVEFFFPTEFRNLVHSGLIHEEAVIRGNASAVQSIFGHPGIFSWYMAFCFCISVASFMTGRSRRLALLFIGMFALGVLLSLRRKSLIACVLCAIVIILVSRKGVISKTKYVSFGLFILLGAYLMFYEELNFLFSTVSASYDFSASHYVGPRVALTETSVLIANDRFPLGSGLGTFGSWMSRVDYSPVYAVYGLNYHWGLSEGDPRFLNDTYWPMVIGELGYIGCFLVLMLWLGLVKDVYVKFKSETQPLERFFALVGLALLIEILIESLASPSLSRSPQIFFVMAIVGISFRKRRSKHENNALP